MAGVRSPTETISLNSTLLENVFGGVCLVNCYSGTGNQNVTLMLHRP